MPFLGPFFANPYYPNGSQRAPAGVPASDWDRIRVDATIYARLADLFVGVTRDTRLHAAMNTWRREEVGGPLDGSPASPNPAALTDTLALFLAVRGVPRSSVEIIVDTGPNGGSVGTDSDDFVTPATLDRLERFATVHEYTGAHTMHNKFFLFSELSYPSALQPAGFPSAMRWVVAQTSSNIRPSQMKQAQNLLIIHGERDVYETYLDIWQDIREHLDGEGRSAFTRLHGHVKVYSSPRTSDTYATVLGHVLDNLPGRRSERARTRVYVVAHRITQSGVYGRLIDLRAAGCDVCVVVGRVSENPAAVESLVEAGVPVRALPTDLVWDASEGKLHDKYLVLEARYPAEGDPVAWRKLVWTGSRNFTRAGWQSHSEVLLRVNNGDVHRGYNDDFLRLWGLASPVRRADLGRWRAAEEEAA